MPHLPRKLLLIAVLFTAVICGQLYPKCLNQSEIFPKKYLYIGDHTVDIKLEVSKRPSHQLVTHIFQILLEEVVGYANVTLVTKQDFMNATQVLNRIAGCSLQSCQPETNEKLINPVPPETMLNLEVWMGPGYNIQDWIRSERIEHCGPLGPVGRLGWFVPKMFVKQSWETQRIAVDHWRTLQNEQLVNIFNLSDDIATIKSMTKRKDDNYYCNVKNCDQGLYYPKKCLNNASCAVLLASTPEASKGMIRELIDSLNLRVKVAWIGPNLEPYVRNRMLSGKPVLFFNWKPNVVSATENYTNVAFPRCEDLSNSFTFPSNCAFEINQLSKVAWKGLRAAGPEVVQVASAISFTQKQYQDLTDSYKQNDVRGVACSWLKNNVNMWKKWIPVDMPKKMIIYIGGIFPISGINYSSRGIIPAAQMAVNAINKNETVLKDYKLELLTEDGQCSADHVMRSFIRYVTSKKFPKMVGILGPACTDTVEPIAGVSKHYHAIIISYSAEGTIFSNNKDYPYFFRTISSNKQFKHVYLPLFQRLGWTRVATLTQDGMRYPEYLSLTQDYLQVHGINFIVNRKFPRDRASLNMTRYLLDLKEKRAKIIIGDFYDVTARAIFCEAFKQGMTSHQGYTWFLPRWFSPDWYDTDFYNNRKDIDHHTVPCTTREMLRAIDGYMSLGYAFFNDDDEVTMEGFTVGEWKRRYRERLQAEKKEGYVVESEYAGYAYDAVWVYALGLDKLLKYNHTFVASLHTERTTRKFADIINQTDFLGVSGNVRFVGPSRVSVINILQWVGNRTYIVGRYIPNAEEPGMPGRIDFNETKIIWMTPDGRVPDDGREVPGQCALESFANLLGVNCEIAIIIANIIGFGLFAVIMLLCVIFFKRRYERRVRMTENRMKELGLMTANNMLALDRWEVPRDCVVINRKIGEGAFGTVYGGEVYFDESGWVAVAVKTLKIGSSVEEKLDFLSEAEMMKRFDHQNIVSLLGVCTRGEPVYTIMEFMLYGDLKTYLLARRHMVSDKYCDDKEEISDRRLTLMALDIARGLSYLAEMKYVHRDLACRNCLVDSSRIVKIADFGMTRPMYDSDYYRFNKKGMLPVRWMAPESLADGIFTPASDIWSYGVLLYEVITFGSFPFQGLSNNNVLELVKAGYTLNIPKGSGAELEALLKLCWNREPSQRPTALSIVEILASNPLLLAPCLDLPLASVEIEGTDSLELQMLDRGRKYSTTPKLNPMRRRSAQADMILTTGHNECTPLCTMPTDGPCICTPSVTPNGLFSASSGDLKSKQVSSSPSNFRVRYVTLQHKDDRSASSECIGSAKTVCKNAVTSL